MACHRILIVGAPASGRAWLAERIHALTGIPVRSGDDDGGAEWIRLAGDAGEAERAADGADLLVLVRTPVLLRSLRVLLRRVTRRDDGDGAPRPTLRGTRRWDDEHLPRVRALLAAHPDKAMTCQSSEDVRAVLERVFGLDGAMR